MITGTFIDEITYDIPSANWGPEQWMQDFDAMRSIGIDTVIVIRGGLRDQATFNSKVLNSHRKMRPVYFDLADFFLKQAQRCEMKLFFGSYDSEHYLKENNPEKEARLNIDFTNEFMDRYGHYDSLGGWYLSHELSGYDEKVLHFYSRLSEHLRTLNDYPILISPFIRGRKEIQDFFSPQEHREQWDKFFAGLSGVVDIVAFQDGHVEFGELEDYMKINIELADKYGIESWSNVETFERGMPIKFLPIAWSNMRYKMEIAQRLGISKMITFEFSHFMSPNSMYHSAHNLFAQYCEYMETIEAEVVKV